MLRFDEQRVAVLVDSENLYGALTDEWGRLDYELLMEHVLQGRKLVRAIAYVSRTEGTKKDSFIEALLIQGFDVRVFCRQPSGTRRDWDVGIAVDAMLLAPKVENIVVVSGDGDFVYLYHALRAMGIRVEVASFVRNLSDEVRDIVDEVHLLDDCKFETLQKGNW